MVPVAEPTFQSKTPVIMSTKYKAAWKTRPTLKTLHASMSRKTRDTLRTRRRDVGVGALVLTL